MCRELKTAAAVRIHLQIAKSEGRGVSSHLCAPHFSRYFEGAQTPWHSRKMELVWSKNSPVGPAALACSGQTRELEQLRDQEDEETTSEGQLCEAEQRQSSTAACLSRMTKRTSVWRRSSQSYPFFWQFIPLLQKAALPEGHCVTPAHQKSVGGSFQELPASSEKQGSAAVCRHTEIFLKQGANETPPLPAKIPVQAFSFPL